MRLDDDVAQWAIPLPLRLLTTVYVVTFSVELELDEIVIPDGGELTTSLVVFTVADGVDGIFPIIGVAGALYIPVTGVGGTGKLPSATGLQPDLIASEIVVLVRNSDTHAALSYRLGILDPGSHVPRVSIDLSVSRPWAANCAPAVT